MKAERQKAILQLIAEKEIETQEELAEYLAEAGFRVTQATVSRDIRELNLKKKPGTNRALIYTVHQGGKKVPEMKYVRVLRDSFLSMDVSLNLLVIRTIPGMAMAAAAALDACSYPEILGCIAGDDTIMCAIRSASETEIVKEKIEALIK